VIKAVTDKVAVNIPEAVIDRQIDRMIQDFKYQMTSQGISLDLYYQMTGSSEEELRDRMKPDAERNVKDQMVLDQITKMEEITASEEEIEQEIESLATQYGQDIDEFKETAAKHDKKVFADNVVLRKTIDFLVEHATIKEKEETEQKPEASDTE